MAESFFIFLLRIILVSNKLLILSSSVESTWLFFLLAGTNQICLKTSQLAPVKLVPVKLSNPLKQRAVVVIAVSGFSLPEYAANIKCN